MDDHAEMSGAPGEEGRVNVGFVVTGRVQGVGFRWWTRGCARALGISGTVKNQPDGSVAICAQAPSRSIAEFEARLWSGPAMARVDGVARVPCDLSEGTTGFTIEH